jgi:hypothetical protein
MTDGILEPKHNPRVYGLAYGTWLVSAVLAVLVFIAGRELVIRTYTRFFPWDAWRVQMGQGGLSLINIMISLPLTALVIAIIIGGFEYQHRNMGTPEAWQMLARTLAVEIGILLLALYL